MGRGTRGGAFLLLASVVSNAETGIRTPKVKSSDFGLARHVWVDHGCLGLGGFELLGLASRLASSFREGLIGFQHSRVYAALPCSLFEAQLPCLEVSCWLLYRFVEVE